ncbi:hypothetical protein KP509_37G026400 [Ceratopteris richardii]|uniref:DNA-3-methyladenine glycosylase I n=1 Tax=Ceratopteris richardii TaxID=49495 RepID=A0A8T2Q754_CERRI|nr:hypothetical protein KP509_37G026400 [Ceratopteris richardii]
MSTDIGGRAVLRPAGNVARANLKKTGKPPPSPIKSPLPAPSSKASPPSPLPLTNKTQAKTSALKSSSPVKVSPHRPPIPSPISLNYSHQDPLLMAPLDLTNDGIEPVQTEVVSAASRVSESSENCCNSPSICGNDVIGTNAVVLGPDNGSDSSPVGALSIESGSNASSAGNKSALGKGAKPFLSSSAGKKYQNGSTSSSVSAESYSSRAQRTINPRISLNRSTSEVFQRSGTMRTVKSTSNSRKNLSKLGSLSFDESSLATMVAAKKAAAKEISAQRKQKVSAYGRKQSKACKIAPEVSTTSSSPPPEPQRCKFITAQSDPIYVNYHDQEWGVPVHEDRILFELLVLAGFQAELSWTTILHNRCTYNEKLIVSLEADKSLGLPSGKVRGVVNNAQKILQVVQEFGSLDDYLWGFVNKQPMMNNYRYPKQVPTKTSKSEVISKDLVKRGFRFVGPTIIHSFMQASGMTNDHLVQCFRHQECASLSAASSSLPEERPEGALGYEKVVNNLNDLSVAFEGGDGDSGKQWPECEVNLDVQEQEDCMHALGSDDSIDLESKHMV